MSKTSNIKITCPACNLRQDFVTWDTVNVLLNPEMKAKVLDKSVFNLTCVNCHTSALVQYPLLYHDQQKKYMIWLIPSEEDTKSPEIPQGPMLMPGYKLRIVKTINRLIEKIFIFNYELDDRVVEIIKNIVWKARFRRQVEPKDIYFSNAFTDKGEIIITIEMLNKKGNHNSLRIGGITSDYPLPLKYFFALGDKELDRAGWDWIDFNFPMRSGK